MKEYTKLNNIIGWIVGIAASTVFIMTAESTASFWDCGEFIASAFKLEVGHPPGAPTFNLLGRIVSLLSFGNVQMVGVLINYLSAVCSGLAVMFMFWITTYLARKFFIVKDENEFTKGDMYAVFGAGVVGAMSFTFCDSFWFSAVEGEVYSMAAFFTSIIFWCATKWERDFDKNNSLRWIILVGFLIGLSVGVHLLNLLAIPAMGYIYYFKKHKATIKGVIFTTIISMAVTGLIMSLIIPGIVNLFGKFELLFVNGFGLPFNSGTIIFTLLIIAVIVFGLKYTVKYKKPLTNALILAFTFLLFGYSTYLILVIRSNANTPLNENAPKDAVSLLSYLNREQYGDWPVLYGQYYNSPLDSKNPYKDGSPYYTHDDKMGKYVITDERKNSIPNYDPQFCTIFPRMWKSEKADEYKEWGDVKGIPISSTAPDGETSTIYKPTFGENLTYFFRYQIAHMYFRYFMWNFVGRQNDVQSTGDPIDGNWMSGIT
ncbi:MAG: DUF2723 domain-containing protein, partial [Bacteroidetes bacterium]|nr:DUF2723 domain-containing protein [Bacteroidota bacterium]